ncbi:MAG: hypothetical protein ACRBK7_14435 [Acidimicrobiales bacterium]
MATTSPEHRVACHQYASERKQAGRKVWDLRLTLGPFDDDGSPQQWAAMLAEQLKGSRWAAADLANTKRAWVEEGAMAEPTFDDTPLGEIVDQFDDLASSEGADSGDVNWLLDEMYYYADLGPTRVFITLERN